MIQEERLFYSIRIQGDSGGRVSISAVDSIGHCEKGSAHEHVSDSE